MFESTNLVPNLNEIMEEYIKREERAVQETQAETGQEEERAEARAELEQPVEETRKRKKGAEEVRAKHSEKKASDWVSKLAYFS